MTMTADRPSTSSNRRSSSSSSPSQRLKTSFAAARVSFSWFGVRKSLSSEQKNQAAEPFDAQGAFLSATKKLIDTREEKFAAVSTIRHQIQSLWRDLSLPYPEPGIRLIKQADIESFDRRMREHQTHLADAVEQLDRHFEAMKAVARDRLGSLYNEADYPTSLRDLFQVSWDFPSIQPPEYLLRLNPQLYQQEQARMQAKFEEAVKLAETAFSVEFAKLVEHLTERLANGDSGQRKTFRDSAIGNLVEFFGRFKSLNIHSNAELDRLVETAQRAIAGVDPQAIRDSDSLRQQISSQLSTVAATLDQMLVDQPRRRILRQPKEALP